MPSRTVVPLGPRMRAIAASSPAPVTGFPSTVTSRSPARIPASAAGLSSKTRVITTPLPLGATCSPTP